MTMPSSECDKYHKTFIPMMPLHMGHGDHLYESTRVGGAAGSGEAGSFSLAGVPGNTEDPRPHSAQEADSGVDASSSMEPPDIQFVDILKPSLQHHQGGACGTVPRVPRASDFHIYSRHEDFSQSPAGAAACHVDTIICPIHQCHSHQQQQQLQHSVHSLVATDEDT